MSAGRFFVAPDLLGHSASVVLPPAVASQVRTVLRLGVGDHITLLDGTGQAHTLRLTHVERDAVVGEIVASQTVTTEPRARLTLYLGMLKAAKFEWVIQKGTEIGVSTFVPLVTERTTDGLEAASPAKLHRWHTIAVEAAEQCDRGMVPLVAPPLTLAQALHARPTGECALLAWEAGIDDRRQSVAPTVQGQVKGSAALHLFVGPEGGFTPGEVELAASTGATLVTLGPRILRAETAALVLVTLTLAALGELD